MWECGAGCTFDLALELEDVSDESCVRSGNFYIPGRPYLVTSSGTRACAAASPRCRCGSLYEQIPCEFRQVVSGQDALSLVAQELLLALLVEHGRDDIWEPDSALGDVEIYSGCD